MALVGLGAFFALSSCTERTSPSPDSTIIKASMNSTTQQNIIQYTEEDIQNIKSLFELNEKSGWYHHKQWGNTWPQRRTLFADVNKTGYYSLCSNYYSKHGIDHEYIEAVVGDKEIKSRKVELTSDDHRTQKRNGKTFEVNYYSNYGDEGILEAIAKSNPEQEITIRFIGKKGVTVEEILDSEDRKALTEALQLSVILRKENQQIGKR